MLTLDPSKFRAPITHEILSIDSASSWAASPSGARFPHIDAVPLLFPDARWVFSEMKTRARALIAHYQQNIENLKLELKTSGHSQLTRTRLEKTRQVQIHHLEFLRKLFSPLKLSMQAQTPPPPQFGYRLPSGQGLQGYFPNLVRDWAIHVVGENEKQLALVEKAVGSVKLGRLLVLGSGASRLAYEIHENLAPSETVCADLNLILTLASSRIVKGETLHVAEFPIAPRNIEAASGRIRECRAPKAVRAGFSHIFADAYHLPFASGSLDTVLTPWLVDILPHRLDAIVSEINRVLKPGGRWINSGSFNFKSATWAERMSIEEGLELIQQNGFIQVSFSQDFIPYLRSDMDAHARSEMVTTFVMSKIDHVTSPIEVPMRPAWLINPHLPVPIPAGAAQAYAGFESQAFVLALIDGQRSIHQIAQGVSQKYGLELTDALDAAMSFMTRFDQKSFIDP